VPLVWPPSILMMAGTVATLLELLMRTDRPSGGAGLLRTTVTVDGEPPVTKFGLSTTPDMEGVPVEPFPLRVRLPLACEAFNAPVIVMVCVVGTPKLLAVKEAAVCPAGMVTDDGLFNPEPATLSMTTAPPSGATPLRLAASD